MLRSFLAPGARIDARSRESMTCSRRCISAELVSRIAVPRMTIKGVKGHMERFLLAVSSGGLVAVTCLPVYIHLDLILRSV